MNILLEAHKRFLLGLLEAEVSFLMVGGHAVIYHGYPRSTLDLDIWLQPANSNKDKLLPVLASFNIAQGRY